MIKLQRIMVLVSILLLAGCGRGPGESAVTGASYGKEAPDFTLLDLDGEKVSLSDFKGKVVVLDFWATWCPPCRKVIPHFIELYKKYNREDLEVIGIALDQEGARTVSPFVQNMKMNYRTLLADGNAVKAYGITAIPTIFFIDKAGNIRNKHVGYQSKIVLEKEILALLREK